MINNAVIHDCCIDPVLSYTQLVLIKKNHESQNVYFFSKLLIYIFVFSVPNDYTGSITFGTSMYSIIPDYEEWDNAKVS